MSHLSFIRRVVWGDLLHTLSYCLEKCLGLLLHNIIASLTSVLILRLVLDLCMPLKKV